MIRPKFVAALILSLVFAGSAGASEYSEALDMADEAAIMAEENRRMIEDMQPTRTVRVVVNGSDVMARLRKAERDVAELSIMWDEQFARANAAQAEADVLFLELCELKGGTKDDCAYAMLAR